MMLKLATIAALVASAAAHMAMNNPCPRHSRNCAVVPPLPDYVSDYDNDIKSPISSIQKPEALQPLCKRTQPWANPVASWTAGQSVTVGFQSGGAAHSGGHCQFSLSYDGGKTFAVVHEELQHCFFTSPTRTNQGNVLQYTFNLPADLPSSDKAVFAWTWVNASGNREFYMNCADVAVKGTSKSFTGKKMTIANYPGFPTIPEFNGNYDTGLEFYKNQPMITISGNGGSAPAPVVPSAIPQGPKQVLPVPSSVPAVPLPPVLVPTVSIPPVQLPSVSIPPVQIPSLPTPPVQFPAHPVPVPSVPVVPLPPVLAPSVPVPVPTLPGGCNHGAYQCSADGTGFTICVWGKWSAVIGCGSGTVCKKSILGALYCGWP
ncbi:hypothetical protein H4R19_002436 [Coemansia spiralis]|nr:hypothetical protein H4R19_002436 [Coemansia spiralis]